MKTSQPNIENPMSLAKTSFSGLFSDAFRLGRVRSLFGSTMKKYGRMRNILASCPRTGTIGLLLALSLNFTAAADLTYTFDNSIGYSNFLLGSRLLENASFSASNFTLSSILTDRSRAYLDISHSQIYPFAEYSSSKAELGLQLRYLELQDHQFFAGLYGQFNRFRDTYSYYNSNDIGMYLKWKYYFKASRLITTGFDLNFNQFDEITEASNTLEEVYFSYNQSFRSRTSINLHSSLALQDFWSYTVLEDNGRRLVPVEVDDIPNNQLFRTELRISQSLGPKIGLTLWLESQSLLNEQGGTLVLQDGMNNPFIDRFRWEGPSTALRLMYRVNARNTLKISHSFFDKQFLDVPVYLYDFETQNYVVQDDAYVDLGMDRSDSRHNVQLTWSLVRQDYFSACLAGLELNFNLGWTRNSSNDPLYDYESKNYSISINLNN